MKHIVTITEAPHLSGRQSIPDGAVNGNGDLGIILGNSENGMRIYLSKIDLWQGIESHDKGGLKPLGYIDIPVPAALYENYHAEQDMDKGEIRCRFHNGEDILTVDVRACRAENSVMLEIGGNTPAEPELKVFGGETSGEKGEISADGINGIFRSFSGADHAYETHCFAFLRRVDSGRYYLFAATNHDVESPESFALGKVKDITPKKYDSLLKEHYSLWQSFWSKSEFNTRDEELENGWYSSQYFLAGCTGNKGFAPGIFANFITIENPGWHSDYHLNYNYQAPFYAACSSNHIEFTDCYHIPLEEFFEKGSQFAAKWGCRGILYPVGLAPKGLCSELTPALGLWFERLFLGQKSNAIHPADIMVFRWRATRDKEYAEKHAYPYIKAALEFFEDWMTFDGERYSVTKDAAHEVPYYRADFTPQKYRRYINDTNNSLTLGMLRLCIPAAIEMATELGIDEDKCRKWSEILQKLSPFPTYYRFFRKVFSYTEKGQKWNYGNDVGLQHMYPAGCVGLLKSDPEMLRTAKNTFEQKSDCWLDDNAVCSYFPMAARLGHNPKEILKRLHELKNAAMLPNMLFNFAGGCLENCPVFANTLNEMVMQSFEGIINLFPCWDKELDVSFKTLRADGAFLVSSEMKGGKITFTEISSEIGGELCVKNPYKKAVISHNGKRSESEDDFIKISTAPGDTVRITAN